MDKPNCDQCRIGMELTHYEKSWSGQYTLKFECHNCHSTTETKPDHVDLEVLGKLIVNEKTEEEKLQEKLVLGKNMMHQRLMEWKKRSGRQFCTYSEEEKLFIKEGDFSQDGEVQKFLDFRKKLADEIEEEEKEKGPKIRSEIMINCWTNKEDDFEHILKLTEEMKSENTLQFVEKYVMLGQEQAMKFSDFETMMGAKLDKPNFVFDDKPYDKLALLGHVTKMVVAQLKIEEFRKLLPTPVSFDKLIAIAAEHIDVTHKFELFLATKTANEIGYNITMEEIEQKFGEAKEANKVKHTERLLDMKDRITIEDCDRMTWKDFEISVGKLYEKMGYESKKTPNGPDGGCDLILTKKGKKTVVDAKHWKSAMHVKTIGQIYRAQKNYHADSGTIVGISTFTKETVAEAKKNKIELVDRDRLEKMLYDYPITQEKKSNSELTINDVYETVVDDQEIIRELMKMVLNNVGDWYGVRSGPTIQQEISWQLKKKLLSQTDQERILGSVIEFLKDDNYGIDLTKDQWNMNEPDPQPKVDLSTLQGRPRSVESLLSTFMETIRLLEGDDKSSVPEQELINELIKSEKFKDEDRVKRFIRKMINEAAIYEGPPGYYNTV